MADTPTVPHRRADSARIAELEDALQAARHLIVELDAMVGNERAAVAEMLAALKMCVEALGNDHPGSDEYWHAYEAAEAAIAKAESRVYQSLKGYSA